MARNWISVGICLGVTSAALAAGCGGRRAAVVTPAAVAPVVVDNRGEVPLEIVNDLGQTVCYIHMSPSTDPNWGNDWLGSTETLAPGATRLFGISAAQPWDLRAQDCGHATLAEGRNLPLQGPSRVYLLGTRVEPLVVAEAAAPPPEEPVVTPAPVAVDVPAAVIREDRIEINQSVLFQTDSAELLPESSAILDQVAGVFRSHPEIRRVRVEGHTDTTGNAARNQTLSQERAASVVTYLQQHGVTATLDHVGHGQSRPLCSEPSPECHARNRRVEFVIVERGS